MKFWNHPKTADDDNVILFPQKDTNEGSTDNWLADLPVDTVFLAACKYETVFLVYYKILQHGNKFTHLLDDADEKHYAETKAFSKHYNLIEVLQYGETNDIVRSVQPG